MSNKAIAVVGMCGSGKSEVTEIFVQNGWQKVYFGGVTVSELVRQGIEVNEANERKMREGLRAKLGMGAFAIILEKEICEKLAQTNVVLDGLYSWSEYTYLKEKLGDSLELLSIVTDSEKRYARLANRPIRPLTREQAMSRDRAEIENMEKGGPIARGDYFICNNGTQEELKAKTQQMVEFFQNK